MDHRINTTLLAAAMLAFSLILSACGPKSTDEAPDDASTSAEILPVVLPRTPSPDGASVYFVAPANGATVSNPVSIEFGIDGMAVVKAGDKQPDSGHHHLLIDTDLPDPGLPIPSDAHHLHFGDGSSATEITLQAGEHNLQMLLGDHSHIPHDPPVVSEQITITVE